MPARCRFKKETQWSEIAGLFKDEDAVLAYQDDQAAIGRAFASFVALDPWARPSDMAVRGGAGQ
jgi:hypothetical protein